jgi:diguanylate cyclase
MTEKNNSWREKYRRSVADCEHLESVVEAQKTMLLRAVLNLSAAANGRDVILDKRLHAIISSVKTNDASNLDLMLRSLPKITEEVSKRQQDQWSQMARLLQAINTPLQKRPAFKRLTSVVNNLKKLSSQVSSAMMRDVVIEHLQQLTDIQQETIANAPTSKKNIFHTLFTNKPTIDSLSYSDAETEVIPDSQRLENIETPITSNLQTANEGWEQVDEKVLDEQPRHLNRVSINETQTKANVDHRRERSIPESILREKSSPHTSAKVPGRVSVILIELLDHLKAVPAGQQKALNIREHIAQGLRWFELAPALEDIRDFVLQAHIGADKDYQHYLEHLCEELSEILSALGVSIKTEEQMHTAANALQENVNQGMDNMTRALSDNNIDTLKYAVESHVQQLQLALTQFSRNSNPDDESKSLKQQLQNLSDKVQMMETKERSMAAKLTQETQRAMTDSLTNLPNREAYNDRVHQELKRWQRYQKPLTLAIVDIDLFKRINDSYGHQVGDKVLKIVATTVRQLLREVDFMARFGGEEFVILLPETATENALILLDRIRNDISNKPLSYGEEKLSVTLSIGITQFEGEDSTDTVFARADEAMYGAKEGGRNQCIVY